MTATTPGETFAIGDIIRVRGERGVFRVRGYGKDGSVTVWGGPKGQECFRSFWPCRARRTKESGPSGIPGARAPQHKAGRR